MGEITQVLRRDPFLFIQIHPLYPFRNGDTVSFVWEEDLEDEREETYSRICYGIIDYIPELGAFGILLFEDETCSNFIWEDEDSKIIKIELLADIGIENLKIINEKDSTS